MSNNKYSILRLVPSQIYSLKRECNAVFQQCFRTGHCSKLDYQWVLNLVVKLVG
jgi:hypothetical protein